MNIILDMDETLITTLLVKNSFFGQPIARPFLKQFFEFIFEKFERVSIWTHANKEWYDIVYNKILKHVIPNGKSFHFVRTRDDIYHYNDFIPPNIINKFLFSNIKPLQLIYNCYPNEYNEYNTYILDDNPSTYLMNKKNAIPIKPFNKLFISNDIELIIIMNFIEYKLKFKDIEYNKFNKISKTSTSINLHK